MDVATARGLRSSAALLSESMGVGVARLERSKRIDSRSIPRTSSRVVLPLDSALQELSQSLGESSGLWERPSRLLVHPTRRQWRRVVVAAAR